MKLGFVSAILDGWSFEEMIDAAHDMGYQCVEVACWPQGKAERRYAGVSHIDVDALTDEKAVHILNYCREKGVEISSPEEVAYINGWITADDLAAAAKTYGKSAYGAYLQAVVRGEIQY